MYTDFYNLREKPFNLTSSPRFLYLGETHKEALSALIYGVMERKGFVLLTGEVGTGKTTVVHTLLETLDSSVKYIYLSNPTLPAEDFLFYVASGLGLRTQLSSKGLLLVQLEDFLQEFFRRRQNVLLIVDEAQKLSSELLEEIRLLSNLETAEEKLINIFLVGQPELNRKLSQSICRPLLQRISIRYHIRPLDLQGTREYIERRLTVAGAENACRIFPTSVIEAIYQYSEGYPRMINILADNVLLLGYSEGTKRITPAMVKACYQDINLDTGLSEKRQQSQEASEPKRALSSPLKIYWKWALALFLIAFFATGIISRKGQNFLRRLSWLVPISSQTANDSSREQLLAKEKTKGEIEAVSGEATRMESSLRADDEDTWKIVIARSGDSVSRLVASVYGWANASSLNLVWKYNPQIRDLNRIQVSQEIIFPPLSVLYQGPTFTVHIATFKHFEHAQNLFQELRKKGYRAHIISAHDIRKGEGFGVSLGNFNDRQEAEDFAATVLDKGVSGYAKVIHLNTK
jgi:general secretion pathway protein A